ncbi:MAG: hypothetical protein LBQ30_10455 [Treponema sp.]|jgi:TolB-like protein|nr:hypothetical protein [Treponema sp.]
MNRSLLASLLALAICGGVAAKDTLAVLPFTGGEGEDGETIAELFSFDGELNRVFNPIPRTSINQAIRREQRFQHESSMTDPDTIIALGKQLGAQYVVSGNITRLGAQKLLVISILKIDELRQVAGDLQTYGEIEEIRPKLPGMAQNIVAASRIDPTGLPRLAVVPVQLNGGADPRNADVLAQILAIRIIRSGKYAVYPRTSSLEQVQKEYDHQFSGNTADEYLPDIGRGTNPELVLSVTARKLGRITMFNAAIINLLTGVQEIGKSVDYQSLDDGMRVMEELARSLTGQEAELTARRAAEAEATEAARKAAEEAAAAARKKAEAERKAAEKAAAAARKKAEAERKWADFKSDFLTSRVEYAARNSLGLLNVALEWSGNIIGMGVEGADCHWSLLPFTSVGIGVYPYLLGGYDTWEFAPLVFGGSLYAGLVYPLTANAEDFNARLYADGLFNISWPVGIGIGFDAGIALTWDGLGFDIRYRGVGYEGNYVNSLGIGFVWMINDG